MKFFAIALLAVLCTGTFAAQYAFITAAADSQEPLSYAAQAITCHAYQLFLKKGIPADNIIHMSPNDCATASFNPQPGTLYNKPSSGAGDNVYKGCVVDYDSDSVTVDNFLAVLTGGQTTGGNGRVLKSTAEDTVYVYFIDHGAPGVVEFPSGQMYSDQLIGAFKTMHSKGMYKQLVFYMEACHSGSMFENLPSDINVYAVSSVTPTQDSQATYCPPNDKVNGASIGQCLSGLFSSSWLEDDDSQNTHTETLETQFNTVESRCSGTETPQQYGDKSISSETVGTFIGEASSIPRSLRQRQVDGVNVAVPELNEFILRKRFEANQSQENFDALNKQLESQKFFSEKFEMIAKNFGLSGEIEKYDTDFDCYRAYINRFQDTCGKVNGASVGNFKYFFEQCQKENNLSYLQQIDMICA